MNEDIYFEGILQARGTRDEVIEWIRNTVKNKKGVSITKEKKVSNGIDFYITSQHYLQTLGRHLVSRFGGEAKQNFHLQTRKRDTQRNLYRLNLLYIVPFVLRGMVVTWDEGIGVVQHILKKKCVVFNLIFGRKKSVDMEKLKELKVLKTRVCRIKPDVEVLHPENYQPVHLENGMGLKNGQEVQIGEFKGKFYLIPTQVEINRDLEKYS